MFLPTCRSKKGDRTTNDSGRTGDARPSEDEGAIDRDALRLEDDHHLTPRLLAAYCDGSLTPVSEALVMDHLTTC